MVDAAPSQRQDDEEFVLLPHKQKAWPKIYNALTSLLAKERISSSELRAAILTYNPKEITSLDGLLLLHREGSTFYSHTLRKIIALAVDVARVIPSGIPYLTRERSTCSLALNQRQIACLLCNALLCTFTEVNRRHGGLCPHIGFGHLLASSHPDSVQRLACIVAYLSQALQDLDELAGNIEFTRRRSDASSWKKQERIPIQLLEVTTKRVEECTNCVMVDFADSLIGGSILGDYTAQEQVIFAIYPELIVSRLFVTKLEDDECIYFAGPQRFNAVEGYGSSFYFVGSVRDETPIDEQGRRKTIIVAMDAVFLNKRDDGFTESIVERETLKAYTTFSGEELYGFDRIATGSWGCGVFNGDKEQKALIQIVAACLAKRKLLYSVRDEVFADKLRAMFEWLVSRDIGALELYEVLSSMRPCPSPFEEARARLAGRMAR